MTGTGKRAKPGQSNAIRVAIRHQRDQPPVLQVFDGPVAKQAFAAGMTDLFALIFVNVQRQIVDVEEGVGVEIPSVLNESLSDGIRTGEGGITPEIIAVLRRVGGLLELELLDGVGPGTIGKAHHPSRRGQGERCALRKLAE